MSKTSERLYDRFQPEHYDVHVTLEKEDMSYVSKTVLKGVKVGRPTKRLTLHGRNVTVKSAKITKHDKRGDQGIKVSRINLHKKYEEIRLHTDEQLFPGEYTIEVELEAKISDAMQGLYPCRFRHDGKDKMLLATQFESHHAREVLACIDEPAAKATFQLTLTVPKEDTVLSNTPVKETSTKAESQTVSFEKTPRMSTYLLAFVTGEMHCLESKTKDGTIVRSWATVAQPKKNLQYSVKEAVDILEYYGDYFGVPYPLEKCDQVALPDFDAGAMENWGLITYREIVLLADPDNRSISSEQYISMVVAHEISHQWFGNLVTMQWWDDLWLNESFASIMEHMALDAVHPDWHQWEQYVATDVVSTSSRDIYKDIQPVGVEVDDPEVIETLFDPGIVYTKGGRLLKMLHDYIGDQAFRTGLQQYFKKHAFQNTTREDLWSALSASSKEDISALMTPWLEKPGMPRIDVTQNGKKLQTAQTRFLLDGEDDTSKWPVPLLINGSKNHLLLENKTHDFTLSTSDFVALNVNASGHYFTHYKTPEHQKWISKQIANKSLPTETRVNTLNDMYMLSRAGDAKLTDALDVVVACDTEPRDAVWSLMGRIIGAAGQLTDGDESTEKQMRRLKGKIAEHWFEKLDWNDKSSDDANTKQLRHTAVAYTLASENKAAVDYALSQYDAHKDALQNIAAEHRATILSTAVRHGENPGVINNLLGSYSDALPDVQLDISLALSATRDTKEAKRILKTALGKEGFVRAQDLSRWIAYFMRNFYTREIMWQFINDNWDWIYESLSRSKSFDYLPLYCAGPLSTPDWLKKYEAFFSDKKDIKLLQKNIGVGINDIKARVAWRRREEAAIKKWLSAQDLK